MAKDAKAEEFTEELRESFARQIREAVADLPAHQALQLADALCSVHLDVLAGTRVTFRARRDVDGAAIKEDWAKGLSLAEIKVKYRVSRSTAYNHHPQRAYVRRSKRD